MRKPRVKWFLFVLALLAVVIGIPVIINESYKANSGYMTMWGAADALAYYGTILGALVAVATVVVFRVNEKEIAERILEVEKQEQKSLPIRVRMRCQEAVARAHGLNFDELKIELEQLNEATAKMHADIFRPLLQLKQRTFELIRTELSQKADRILNFGGDTHANT